MMKLMRILEIRRKLMILKKRNLRIDLYKLMKKSLLQKQEI